MRLNLDRRMQIIALRNQGMTRRQIAAELGISMDQVGSYLHQLIRDGIVSPVSKQESYERLRVKRRKVDIPTARQMRSQGQSYEKIAQHFGVSASTIGKLLGPSPRITPLQRQLIDLRSQGLSYEQIAAQTDKPAGTVAVMLSRLVRKGVIPAGTRGRKPGGP
jgi:transposase